MRIIVTSFVSLLFYTQKLKSKNSIKDNKFHSVKTSKPMVIPMHTAHILPCVSNMGVTTLPPPAQNR